MARPHVVEAAYGAALTALAAVENDGDVRATCKTLVEPGEVVVPRVAWRARADRAYARFVAWLERKFSIDPAPFTRT